MSRTIRPTLGGSAWTIVVGLFSVALVTIGITSLLGSNPQPLRALAAGGLGVYGLFNVLQTPISLGVRDGNLVLAGLLTHRARAADLDRVELQRGGLRRPWVWRFFLKDGRVAFETDAGLWRRADLQRLLTSAGVRMEPR
jgi:hypothetical protein